MQVGGTWARTALPPALDSASYDAANRHLTFGGQVLAYDRNGNLLSDGPSGYTRDARNRLTGITAGPITATFQYDATGRRTRKTINGLTTDFVHDGITPVTESSPGGTGFLLTGLGVDDFMMRIGPVSTSIFLTDALGSLVATTDSAGGVEGGRRQKPKQLSREPSSECVHVRRRQGVNMNSFRAVVTGTALVFVIVLFAGPAVAADLCPPPTPPITDSDDRRMREKNFSAKDFAEALSYFEVDLPQALRNQARTEDVRNSESYRIGYPNVMTTIKGYVLRQDMLLRLAERDLAVEKNRRGREKKADVASADARFQEAKQRFCDFLKNALYSD